MDISAVTTAIWKLEPAERLQVLAWLHWDPELDPADWLPSVFGRLTSQFGARAKRLEHGHRVQAVAERAAEQARAGR